MSIKLQRIIAHIAVEVYGFKSSQNFFDLGTYFSKRRVLRASKRDLEREISTTVDRDRIFFLPRFRSTKQAAEAFFLAYRLIKSGRPRVPHSFNHNSYSFLQSNQTIQAFLRNYFEELWIPQVLICRLQFQTISCWTDNRRLFRALQSRNWNAGVFLTKKLKGKRKRPKKWNYTLINLCHPVKCIHRLRCLHFEESCSLLIVERRFW